MICCSIGCPHNMDVELLHCPYIGWQLESGLNFSKILHGAMVLDLSGPDVDTGHKMKLLVTDVDADTNGHRRGRMRADLFCNDDLDEHTSMLVYFACQVVFRFSVGLD
ncbi:hypothetical protein ACFX13_006272 [Malus domestica]